MTISQPVRPVEALVAITRLLRDPNDTRQAFRVVRSLDGRQIEPLLERFRRSEGGARLLRDRPSLLATLSDRAALARLPEGSLGRAYLAFVEREGISADGLVAVSDTDHEGLADPEFRFLADRLRDSHDLFHVVTGYRTDLIGEASVLAFTAAQTESPGTTFLVAAGYLRSIGFPDGAGQTARAMIRGAWRRGMVSAWLPGVVWEELLAEPLEVVRGRLGVAAAPDYEELRPPVAHAA